jgi:hypothetical protein
VITTNCSITNNVSILSHNIKDRRAVDSQGLEPPRYGRWFRVAGSASEEPLGYHSWGRDVVPGCGRTSGAIKENNSVGHWLWHNNLFPLHTLLKKDVKFKWKPEQEHVFQQLKAKLTSQPILQYPDFSKEFILTTDASNVGLGAVISQGPMGKVLPGAYASRSLNEAETNYTTTEKKLLAIVWSTRYFRPHLYGRHFKFVIDHKSLTLVMNVKGWVRDSSDR